MTDVVLPTPKSRRRLLIILAAVLVLVIALIVGAFFFASSRASSAVDDYHHAFKAWEAKDESALLAATAALPKDTYILDSDPQSVAALARQEAACGKVSESLKRVRSESARLPVMPSNGLLSKLSSDYAAAGDKSDHRARVIHAYTKQASGSLAQIRRDCSWNIAWHVASWDADKIFAKAEKYTDKQGVTTPGFICDYKEGCIPSSIPKKNAFADLRIKAEGLEKKDVLALLKSTRCAATTYSTACRAFAKNYGTDLELNLAYDKFTRATNDTAGNSGLDSRAAKIDAFEKTMTPRLRKAVLALDPILKDESDVRKHPDWTDNFFEVMDKHLLAQLDGQRQALEKL